MKHVETHETMGSIFIFFLKKTLFSILQLLKLFTCSFYEFPEVYVHLKACISRLKARILRREKVWGFCLWEYWFYYPDDYFRSYPLTCKICNFILTTGWHFILYKYYKFITHPLGDVFLGLFISYVWIKG